MPSDSIIAIVVGLVGNDTIEPVHITEDGVEENFFPVKRKQQNNEGAEVQRVQRNGRLISSHFSPQAESSNSGALCFFVCHVLRTLLYRSVMINRKCSSPGYTKIFFLIFLIRTRTGGDEGGWRRDPDIDLISSILKL